MEIVIEIVRERQSERRLKLTRRERRMVNVMLGQNKHLHKFTEKADLACALLNLLQN